MRVVQIEARDIVMTMEMSLGELEKLRLALECAELDPGKADDRKEGQEACNFLTMDVFPFIVKAIEGIKDGRS